MKVNIYKITNKNNGKIYVGKTIKSLEERFEQHKRNALEDEGNCMILYNAMLKHGVENFEISLIDVVEEDNWQYWERYYIEKLHSKYTFGNYNITDGDDANPMDDPLAREHFYQKVRSREFRELQSRIQKGKKIPKEISSRWGIIQKEIQNRPEVKQKVIMNQPNRFPLKMLDENDNVLKEFISCTEAMKYLNKPLKDAGSLKYICDKYNKNGKRSKLFGYYWTKGDL